MAPLEVEQFARELLDLAKTRPIGEDARVECKEAWPSPDDVAPRLSAMANAARGTPIVLLVGVRNDGSICGCAPTELASWLQKLEARFDEMAPRALPDLRINFQEGTVHVLAFDTPSAPYVVRGAGPASDRKLVQIRRGTRVTDAGRADLIRMVTPHASSPQIELRGVKLEQQDDGIYGNRARGAVSVEATLFVSAVDFLPIIFPTHRLSGSLQIDGHRVALSPRRWWKGAGTQHVDGDGAVIHGAGSVVLELAGYYPMRPETTRAELAAEVASTTGKRWAINVALSEVEERHAKTLEWRPGPDPHLLR